MRVAVIGAGAAGMIAAGRAAQRGHIVDVYEKNGFVSLYKTEELEKLYYDIPQGEHLKTRLLYFDLKRK